MLNMLFDCKQFLLNYLYKYDFRCTPKIDKLEEGKSIIIRINDNAKNTNSEISEINFYG